MRSWPSSLQYRCELDVHELLDRQTFGCKNVKFIFAHNLYSIVQ